MRRLWLTIAAAVLAGMAAGCGVKSAPIAPSLTLPQRINDLSAESVPGGVRLTWSRPTVYTSGRKLNDLAGFRLMRAAGPAPFNKLAELPVTDQERFHKAHRFTYVDHTAQLGQTYLYTIVSQTSDGYESDPSNLARITRISPLPPPNPANFALPTPSLPNPAPNP